MKPSLIILCASLATAQNWPSFRGERSGGAVESARLPTTWDVGKGRSIAWKTRIAGLSHSSPIVWGNRIFITGAVSSNPDTVLQFPLKGALDRRTDVTKHQFRVLALDKSTGKVLWDNLAHEGQPRVARHPHNSYAAATPATDGKRLVAFFGSEGLFAFDLDGKLLWKRGVGVLDQAAFDLPDYKWGDASSPVIYRNLAIVQCDQIKGSFLAAFDLETGQPVWRAERDNIPSWSTPGIYEGPTGAELVANGAETVRGYDPLTGRELWRLKGTSMISVPTPFTAGGLIYVFSGYSRYIQPMYAIRPGARGDITPPHASIAWTARTGAPYLPTPVVYGEHLYIVLGNGVLTCLRAATGEKIYQQRLGQGGYFTASPVAAGGKLYFANEDGEVYVVKAGAQFELLAVNRMGGVTMASPAIAGDTLLIRTQHELIALRTP